MIEKIDVAGSNYKVSENLQKYIKKHIGKLDRYLPKGYKKDAVAKIVVTEIEREKGEKYEISVTIETTGGKVMSAKDECSNVYAGIDVVEAKLTSQMRRFKLDVTPHLKKQKFNIFRRRS
ncbi:ribosome-associated translation inhibitor RaiA [Candidatus Saccharibacteria bacterium]|nr:ribosome-associated translation inhibitor RaiA [Candidatus Saccharibacteria bacterium]